jgi:hypothetical protein
MGINVFGFWLPRQSWIAVFPIILVPWPALEHKVGLNKKGRKERMNEDEKNEEITTAEY